MNERKDGMRRTVGFLGLQQRDLENDDGERQAEASGGDEGSSTNTCSRGRDATFRYRLRRPPLGTNSAPSLAYQPARAASRRHRPRVQSWVAHRSSVARPGFYTAAGSCLCGFYTAAHEHGDITPRPYRRPQNSQAQPRKQDASLPGRGMKLGPVCRVHAGRRSPVGERDFDMVRVVVSMASVTTDVLSVQAAYRSVVERLGRRAGSPSPPW